MHLKLIEPLRELFKDEVRELGAKLGLPEKWYNDSRFPDLVSPSESLVT